MAGKPIDQAEAETGAFARPLARKERLECPRQYFRGHTGAGIGDLQADKIRGLAGQAIGQTRFEGPDPQHAAAWTNWGRLLHEGGELQKSLAVYEQAVAGAQADAVLLFNRGVLLEDLGDAGAALESYQRALEDDPDFADCHYNLARLYESMGKPQHAIRHLGQYRRLLGSETR